MEQAIKKSIEGGWICKSCVEVEKNWHWHKSNILLDPLFWQALGKEEGWKSHINFAHKVKILGVYGPEWRFHWHRFIDHLASGKDADSFFKELLK